jgi:hypothetical protein
MMELSQTSLTWGHAERSFALQLRSRNGLRADE